MRHIRSTRNMICLTPICLATLPGPKRSRASPDFQRTPDDTRILRLAQDVGRAHQLLHKHARHADHLRGVRREVEYFPRETGWQTLLTVDNFRRMPFFFRAPYAWSTFGPS